MPVNKRFAPERRVVTPRSNAAHRHGRYDALAASPSAAGRRRNTLPPSKGRPTRDIDEVAVSLEESRRADCRAISLRREDAAYSLI